MTAKEVCSRLTEWYDGLATSWAESLPPEFRVIVEAARIEAAVDETPPRVIVCTQGGVVVGARATSPISVEVLDLDELAESEDRFAAWTEEERACLEALNAEYPTLPIAVY